jgi:hypothetical protein
MRLRIRLSLVIACLSVLTLASTLAAAPAYPLKVGPTGRYLVDRNGAPFLIVGDSPQALIGRVSESEAEMYFARRQAQGFNTVWINLLCAAYIRCNADGSTFDGIAPFTTEGDLTTPNEAYFARVDAMLRIAARHGFLVILDPAETGDWLAVLYANGEDNCRAYGQFLGRRYAGFDNIIWMHGNDYQEYGPDPDRFTIALARGIKDFDSRHLQTVELNFLVSSSTDDPLWIPLIDLNAAYTYEPVYAEVLKDYNRNDGLPVFMVESGYEFENGDSRAMRAQAYWSVLSGATGHLYGNRYTWPFLDGWQDQLDSPGALHMANFTALVQSRPWFQLVPDQNHDVVTSGLGDFGSTEYVTAARTSDGRLVIAYVPSGRTITVDMGRLSGPAIARWYDPASGAFLAISDSALSNSGVIEFTTPGTNADGYEDWVLVLEASFGSPPPPPPSPPPSAPSFINFTIASDTFRPGDQLDVSLQAFNGAQSNRELYTGVLGPDDHSIVYFVGSNTIGGGATARTLGDLRPFALLTPGQTLTISDSSPLLTVRVPSGLPAGVYTLFALLVSPGNLPSSLFDPGDGDVVAFRAIRLLP